MAFFSKKFCPRMMQASTYLRELYAITTTIKKGRQYRLGNYFIIQIDHKPLKDLFTQTVQTPEQQFYMSKLLGYNYTIQYRPGRTNATAYALSRIPDKQSNSQLRIMTVSHFQFLEEFCTILQSNQQFQSMNQDIEQGAETVIDYKLQDNLIFFKGKIWLPPSFPFGEVLMT